MANVFTYRAAPSKYRCGSEMTNLTVILFFGPSSSSVPLACAYCCNMNIDTDGDPQSYGPLNTPNIRPLDSLKNAGYVEPDQEGPDFKTRGNKQRKKAYDEGIAAARTEYEELQKQWVALDPKTVEQKRKDLDQKIADADKALNVLREQKAVPQKIGDADKALNDLRQQKDALDPEKAAKERADLAREDRPGHFTGKIKAARDKIYELNRDYEFKPLPDRWKHEPWRQELWQPGDANKPVNLGKIFWHWYGVAKMTPHDAKIAHPVQGTNKTPILYHPDFLKNPGPIHHEMYEDINGEFPVVQQGGAGGEPGPGYFVSTLARRINTDYPEWDQRSTIPRGQSDVRPYGAVASQLKGEARVDIFDKVLAIGCDDGGKSLVFPFLDSGYGDAVAECSWRTFSALGGTFDKYPWGQLKKSSEPRFLYLAFPNKQEPQAVLSQIGALDNGNEFTMILAFLVQATLERSPRDPVQDYESRKKQPQLNQDPTMTNLATIIDMNLRTAGCPLA